MKIALLFIQYWQINRVHLWIHIWPHLPEQIFACSLSPLTQLKVTNCTTCGSEPAHILPNSCESNTFSLNSKFQVMEQWHLFAKQSNFTRGLAIEYKWVWNEAHFVFSQFHGNADRNNHVYGCGYALTRCVSYVELREKNRLCQVALCCVELLLYLLWHMIMLRASQGN